MDTPPENGSFECLDGFHRRLDSWLDTLPEDTDNITQAMNDEFQGQAFRVGASAGDLVICTRLCLCVGFVSYHDLADLCTRGMMLMCDGPVACALFKGIHVCRMAAQSTVVTNHASYNI